MKRAILSSAFLLVAACAAHADVMELVTVNTSSLPTGTTGFIDLAFNGGYPATAAVSGFSMGGGSLDSSSITTQGTVSGSLPATVSMLDDNSDYDEGITFGSGLRFLVTFSGTPSGNTGDVFTLLFFNSSFTGGLLTGNVNDFWLVQFQLDTQGNVVSTEYNNPAGGASFATATSVPEPSPVALVPFSLLLILAGELGKRLRRT